MLQRNYNYITAALLFYGVLCLHTGILYSGKLNVSTIAVQALYRWLVATTPLFITLYIAAKHTGKIRILLLVMWIFFIPYPYYNFFQLRHIAEVFDQRDGMYLTQSNSITLVWKIIPTAIYALSQLVIYYFCLYKINLKRLPATVICFYASGCTAFGLSVRLDTYHLITKPLEIFNELPVLLANGAFILNATVIFLFCLSGYFLSGFLVKAIKKAPLQ